MGERVAGGRTRCCSRLTGGEIFRLRTGTCRMSTVLGRNFSGLDSRGFERLGTLSTRMRDCASLLGSPCVRARGSNVGGNCRRKLERDVGGLGSFADGSRGGGLMRRFSGVGGRRVRLAGSCGCFVNTVRGCDGIRANVESATLKLARRVGGMRRRIGRGGSRRGMRGRMSMVGGFFRSGAGIADVSSLGGGLGRLCRRGNGSCPVRSMHGELLDLCERTGRLTRGRSLSPRRGGSFSGLVSSLVLVNGGGGRLETGGVPLAGRRRGLLGSAVNFLGARGVGLTGGRATDGRFLGGVPPRVGDLDGTSMNFLMGRVSSGLSGPSCVFAGSSCGGIFKVRPGDSGVRAGRGASARGAAAGALSVSGASGVGMILGGLVDCSNVLSEGVIPDRRFLSSVPRRVGTVSETSFGTLVGTFCPGVMSPGCMCARRSCDVVFGIGLSGGPSLPAGPVMSSVEERFGLVGLGDSLVRSLGGLASRRLRSRLAFRIASSMSNTCDGLRGGSGGSCGTMLGGPAGLKSG